MPPRVGEVAAAAVSRGSPPASNSPIRRSSSEQAPRFRLWDACLSLSLADPPAQTAAIWALASLTAGWLLPLPGEIANLIGQRLAPLLLSVTFYWALRDGKKRIRDRAERDFWTDFEILVMAFAGALVLLFVNSLIESTLPFFLSQLLIAVGFAVLLLAAERQPHRAGYWRPQALERRLSLVSVSALILWSLVYFSVIPALTHGQSEGPASADLLFLILTLLFASRLAWLSWTTSDFRWRHLYGMLAAMGLAITVVFLLDLPAPSTWLHRALTATAPLPWILPPLLATFAARLRLYPFPAGWQPNEPPDDLFEGSRTGLESRTLLLAAAIPLVHFGLHRGGFLDPATRPMQEAWMVVGALTLGCIALVQRHLLGLRLRRVLSERQKVERSLSTSASRLRMAEERKQIDQKLFYSRERYAKAFRASPYALVLSTLADGRMLEWNDRYLQTFGFSQQDMEGSTAEELGIWVDPSQRQRMADEIRRKGSFRDVATKIRHKDGQERSVLISAELLEIGGETCVLSVTRDLAGLAEQAERLRIPATYIQGSREAAFFLDKETRARDWNRAAEKLFDWPTPARGLRLDLPLRPSDLAMARGRANREGLYVGPVRVETPGGPSTLHSWLSRVDRRGSTRYLLFLIEIGTHPKTETRPPGPRDQLS